MRAARAWGARPSEYFKWSARDRGLAEALMTHEASLHSCGHPIGKTTDPDADGWFEVDDSLVCAACAALDRYRKDKKDGPEPGVVIRVVDTRP